MDCPKCNAKMNERSVEVLHGTVVIDQCSGCQGLWFDNGEAEQLKDSWMSDFLDGGDPRIGKTYNRVRDIQCPRCHKSMQKIIPVSHILNTKPALNTACLWTRASLPITNTKP